MSTPNTISTIHEAGPLIHNGTGIAVELQLQQATAYHELVAGLLNGRGTHKLAARGSEHPMTIINDRYSPDGSGRFSIQRDDQTGETYSYVTMHDPETREDVLTWDETAFTQMSDGRVFYVHHFGRGYRADKNLTKSQSELSEMLDKHINDIKMIEKLRNTPKARLARLGRKVMEATLPNPYRINPNKL